MPAPTMSAAHVGKSIHEVSKDPTHILDSNEGSSTVVVCGRDGEPVRLRVRASSVAAAKTAFDQFMGILSDGRTKTY